MAAALAKLATNPKIMSAATNSLNKVSSSVSEKFSNSGSTSSAGTETTTTKREWGAGITAVIQFLWDKLKAFFKFLFLTRSPAAYVAWLIIIILIILGVVGGVTLSKRKSRLATNPNVEDDKKKKKETSSVLTEEPTNEGWRRRAVKQSTDAGTIVDGYQRNLLSGGRCDSLNWLPSSDGKKCKQIIPPATIRWELNADNYPELDELPEKYLEQHEKKLIINIPYKLVGDSFFYADCSDMTYSDGSQVNLFTQKDIKDSLCKFNRKRSKLYEERQRSPTTKDKYTICEKQ